MSNEKLISHIEFDLHQFWSNSVSPINDDSTFLQHSISDINKVYSLIKTEKGLSSISDAFFRVNFLLKDEYLIAFFGSMILTNRRLFIWFSDIKKVIPLRNLIKYEVSKWEGGLKIEYRENDSLQTLKVGKYLSPDLVINALGRHKNDLITEEELEIVSHFKPILESKYEITKETFSSWIEPIELSIQQNFAENVNNNKVSQNPTPVVHKPQRKYKGIVFICFMLLFLGGCIYFYHQSSTSANMSNNDVCGKEFTETVQDPMYADKSTTESTTFNCNGSFESYISGQVDDIRAEGTNLNGIKNHFKGTWEMVKDIPANVKEAVVRYGVTDDNYSILKYKSSNGIIGYCILYGNTLGILNLNQVSDYNYSHKEGALGMFEGFSKNK